MALSYIPATRWKLAARSFALLLAFSLAGPAIAQDWPVARHDYQRTGLQTLGGDIDVPAVRSDPAAARPYPPAKAGNPN